MDNKFAQKALIDVGIFLVCMLILAVVYPMIAKRAAADSADDFWTNERIANAKRLFGDAWEDAL